MDRSAVKAIVDKNIGPLMRAAGIPHWEVRVSYDGRPEDRDGEATTTGDCTTLLDYEQAWIQLHPSEFDDEDDILRVLQHELFHVVASPIGLLASLMRMGLEGAERERMDRVIRYATETTVRNLERMWWGCEQHWKGKKGTGKASAKPKTSRLPKVAMNGRAKGDRDMPKNSKVSKCVSKVKAKGGGVNPYAVCQDATGQSYATGKKTTKAGKPVGGKATKAKKSK
jgi:hypothetical protein